eukprot:360750-Chlamydomonas_euryale.AAC.11
MLLTLQAVPCAPAITDRGAVASSRASSGSASSTSASGGFVPCAISASLRAPAAVPRAAVAAARRRYGRGGVAKEPYKWCGHVGVRAQVREVAR